MTSKRIIQPQYTQTSGNYQLYLPMDVEEMIPMDDSVRLHCLLCERMDYRELLQAYSSKGRKPAVDPVILFKVITYAASQKIYSSREIEKACRRDINFRWLLQGYAAPDHSTISRFKQKYLTDTVMEQLFFQQVVWLYQQEAITGEIICTTHSPYMIDLSKNTHQVLNALSVEKIVIDQNENAFQSDKVFSNPFNVSEAFQSLIDDDKSYVKMLLKIDDSITKIFFTKNVLIVEGDTEELVMRETILRMPKEMRKEFSYNWEVVRARGKATIISLIKYMKALGIKPYVIHDRDLGTPKAYQMNRPISEAMNDNTRIVVLEECIEDLLGYEAPSSNKPYKAYQFINEKWGGEWDNINPQWRTIIESMMSGYSMETLNEAAAAKEE